MKKQGQLLLPHVGNMLDVFYKSRRVNKAGLARAINRAKPSVHKYESRPSLPCGLLWDISVALRHNFFEDIAIHLPETFTTATPKDDSQARRIAQLEEENRILAAQLQLLKEVMGK